MDSGRKYEKPRNPRENANPVSVITFSWILGLFFTGYRRELEETDLYSPLQEHKSSVLGDKLEKAWNDEKVRSSKRNRDPSLLFVILKVFWWDILSHGLVLAFVELFIRTSQPLFLGRLIRYFTQQVVIIDTIPEDSDPKLIGSVKITLEEAYMFAGGVIMCSILAVLIMHPFMMGVLHIGMKVRVACCSLIYRKALKLSKTALGETTIGQIVNLLSNDVNRFDISAVFIHYLWVGPVETIIVTYFLWQEIGLSSLVGVAALLVVIPMQAWLGKKSSSLRLRTAMRTDERVRLMNEIISGIQVIKMYTWEKPFAKLVSYARRKEINIIRKTSYIRGLLLSFIIFHTRVAIFLSIFTYALQGKYINAEKVFVVASYFNILRQTMTIFFPQGIGLVAEALVSIKRLQNFMLYEELLQTDTPLDTPKEKGGSEKNKSVFNDVIFEKASVIHKEMEINDDTAIKMNNMTAKWLPEVNDNTLNDITLDIPLGKLTAVIGLVGSGKSSLLHAILKELPLKSGKLFINGELSYASQEPWLFAGSIRQNILFGQPYERDRYREVTRVCALRTDFDLLPYKDKTVVGDRGGTLSGGQRARVNLARAIYKRADIYLLDDPLSAVDSHVGKHLFEDCIVDFLANKTRILITHQLQYLNNLEHIVMLENGNVIAAGNYKALQESGKDFAKLLSKKTEETVTNERKGSTSKLLLRRQSVQSVASSMDDNNLQDEPPEVAEMRSTGTVGSYVYRSYFNAGGHFCSIMICFLFFVMTQLLASGGDYWITYWVNWEEKRFRIKSENMLQNNATVQDLLNVSSINPQRYLSPSDLDSTLTNNSSNISDSDYYQQITSYLLAGGSWSLLNREAFLYIFCLITVGTVIITLYRSYFFFKLCTDASLTLHDTMFNSITQATMRFFNINSAGRILNRFSKDMGSIDDLLPSALIDCVQIGLSLIGIVVVISIVNYWLLVPTFFVAVLFYYLRLFYLSTSRSVKRLEGVTRSPVFSHLSASIQGLTTIRAFQAQHMLESEFDNHQDLHSSAWYLFLVSSRAFGYWLDVFCVVYISVITLSFLFLGTETFGGNVGLAITQSIGLTGMFQWGMRQSAELENQMTSVERVLEYSNVEKESSLDKKPPDSWPNEGKITFSKVYLRYGPQEPPVLRDLSLSIKPSEKVGIVGRTGAGKSSMILALYRLAFLEGQIMIDDIDTASIDLHDVRSKISIIPQEPVLFSGTMRKNLDPFDEYPDNVLWHALEEVELKEAVSELPGGLNSKMSEGGVNFSVGQRQLVCLARAIVRKNKILVLDEATANVDPKTDSLIQNTIRRKFRDCTMLTIAHRLHTVMDSDRVLVMDAGCLVEFDHPFILLKNSEGFLYKMVEQTGKASAETLVAIATANYERINENYKVP